MNRRKNTNAPSPDRRRRPKGGRAQRDPHRRRALSAQATIPYREMAKDGICRVHDRLYSKTVRFFDLNYQLAQTEDKDAIFEGWCEFLNYFDFTSTFSCPLSIIIPWFRSLNAPFRLNRSMISSTIFGRNIPTC